MVTIQDLGPEGETTGHGVTAGREMCDDRQN